MQGIFDGGWSRRRGKLTRRAVEVLWVLDYLDDLESDFSVFHRVLDIYSLPSRKFFAFAVRISAYDGVMTSRQAAEDEKANRQKGVTVGDTTYREVPADSLAQLGEFVEMSEG